MIEEKTHFYILSNKYLSLGVPKTFVRKKEDLTNESIKLTLKEFKKIKKLFYNIYFMDSDFEWNKPRKWTLKEILKRLGLVNNLKNQLKLDSWLGWIRDIMLHKITYYDNMYSVIGSHTIKNRYLTVYLGDINTTEITMINEMFDELEQKIREEEE